jgi:hypothetical protein
MEQNTLREALLVYVECLAVGKFAKRRWNGPAIDESFYDYSDSDLPSGPTPVAPEKSSYLWDLASERTTLPKAIVSREVLSTLRQWWISLRSGNRVAS